MVELNLTCRSSCRRLCKTLVLFDFMGRFSLHFTPNEAYRQSATEQSEEKPKCPYI